MSSPPLTVGVFHTFSDRSREVKACMCAQLRELMEERARLCSENKSLDMQVRLLQEKVNEAAPLRTEVTIPPGFSLRYPGRSPIE